MWAQSGVVQPDQRSGLHSQAGRFDQDGGGGVVAQGETTTVDDADKGTAAADFGHEGAFAKAHLANALAKGGLAGKRANPPGSACRKLA